MPERNKPAKKNKTHMIGFRVDDDAFSEIETRAALAGKTTNDWCRDELLARLNNPAMLTANEELIHSEVVLFGVLMTHFFDSLAKNDLTPQKSKELVERFKKDRMAQYQNYFAGRKKET